MSFGFLGIQIGFALQNANVSRIFETLGAKVEDIPILWIAAPVDRAAGPADRRLPERPHLGPAGPAAPLLPDRRHPRLARAARRCPTRPTLWVAAGMLWIMDASINISMEPFRAFVGDNLPSEQRTTGFAMQSFLIGTGAVAGLHASLAADHAVRREQRGAPHKIPDSVRLSFYFGAVVFFLAVLWTVLRSQGVRARRRWRRSRRTRPGRASLPERRTAEEFARNGARQIRLGAILLRHRRGCSARGWPAPESTRS